MVKCVPSILIYFRLIAGISFIPLVLCHAYSALLVTLLIAGLLSDIVDGVVARHLGVATLALRRADTKADLVFFGCTTIAALTKSALSWIYLWPWLVAYGTLFATRNIVDYLRYQASPSYHMWSGRLWAVILCVHLAALFYGIHALFLLPIHFGLYAINAAEGIIASLVLPVPSSDIPSVWHVLRGSQICP